MIRYALALLTAMSLMTSCENKNQEIITLADGSTDIVTYEQQGDSIKVGKYSSGKTYYHSYKRIGFEGYGETEVINYYPTGQLRKYALFLNDSLRFFRFYTPEGKIEDCGGNGLIYMNDETTYTDTIKTFHQSFQQLRMAIPPHCIARIIIGDNVDDEETRSPEQPLTLLPMKENKSGFLVNYPTEGTYTKVIYWSIEDTLAKHIQKGRVWRKFVVK